MSPTCTIPYEVLFDFLNDTPSSVTLQVIRREDEFHTGATILIHPEESISLVLTAGLKYNYICRQEGKEAKLK